MRLDNSFEDKLQEALLEELEQKLIGESGNLIHQFVQQAHDVLREYGNTHDYDVEPIIESLGQPQVERSDNSITITIGWDHPAAPHFEFGTSDHTVEGDPVLSFVWSDPPSWVRKEFNQARGGGGQFESGWRVFFAEVDVQGLPESRFVRRALDWLRREVGG